MVLSKSTVEKHIENIFAKIMIPEWANKRAWAAVNAERFMGSEGGNGQH
jgi:DNA-binding NarL/FixJ family response regulator